MTTKQQEQLSRAIGLAQALSRSEQMPPAVQEIGRQIEELLLAARVEARKEKDVPSPEKAPSIQGSMLDEDFVAPALSALGDTCPRCKGKGTVIKDGPSEYEYDNQWPCPECTTDRTALKGTGRAENKGSSLDADGSPVDPLAVKCSYCGARKGRPCHNEYGSCCTRGGAMTENSGTKP